MLSARDFFAGQALNALLQNAVRVGEEVIDYGCLCKLSAGWSDALVNELRKTSDTADGAAQTPNTRSPKCELCIYSELGGPHPESCVRCIHYPIERSDKFTLRAGA